MKLKDTIKDLEISGIFGNENIEIKGITTNSNEVKSEFMFIAIKGQKTDGHNYINSAIKNGASAIVLEKHYPIDSDSAAIVELKNSRVAAPFIASNFFQNPSRNMKLVGITGTNGKTTISYLLEAIWKEEGLKTGIIGTVANRYSDKVFEANLTTPDPVNLMQMLFDMKNSGVTHTAIEVSSHALDLNRVDSCEFDAAVFTNLTQDHLDYHNSFDNYFKAKKRLFTEVLKKSSKKLKFSIINIDDPYGLKLYKETCGEKISYSLKNKKSDIYAKEYQFSNKGISAKIKTPRGRLILNSKLLGEHNLYNLMAAAGTALQIDSSIESIEKALNSISHIPGRLEVIDNKLKINVLVDYAHTPDALQNVLSSLRPICKGRLITVVGCGGDRDKKKRPLMGKIANDNSDYLIITSDNPRTEDPELIIEDILMGISQTNNPNFKTIIDREKAISYSINIATSGDTVLIAGKGHENYQIVGVNKFHFDDREIAEKYLRKRELQ